MFRFLLYFILIYLGIKIIGKFLFATTVKRSSSWNTSQKDRENRNEGDVSVQINNKNNKRFDKTVGEYVKYEEMKEE
jgi:sortase (surface protein transpeptidase)